MDSYHTILGPCWPLGLALTLGLGYGSTAPVFFCLQGGFLCFFGGGSFLEGVFSAYLSVQFIVCCLPWSDNVTKSNRYYIC